MNQLTNRKKWYKKWWGMIIVGGIILVFIILVFLSIIALSQRMKQGHNLPQNFTLSNLSLDNPPATSVKIETDDDPFFGPQQASLVIVEFGDFECPFCRQEFPIVRELMQLYPQVKWIYRDFPVADLHPFAQKAAEAGECAHEQNQFWPMYDKLFQNQEKLDINSLKFYAKQIGLKESEFNFCLNSNKYQTEVKEDLADGLALGVRGTPTFFINGKKVEGAIPFPIFKKIIESELKNQ